MVKLKYTTFLLLDISSTLFRLQIQSIIISIIFCFDLDLLKYK